jgi:hypothetical protein
VLREVRECLSESRASPGELGAAVRPRYRALVSPQTRTDWSRPILVDSTRQDGAYVRLGANRVWARLVDGKRSVQACAAFRVSEILVT